MSKTAKIALGAVVAIAAVSGAGAWYTGTQLPAVLDTSIKEANAQLQQAAPAFGTSATMELVSLEQGIFTSTAHYRVHVGGEEGLELLFVDNIEHGPFPVSRLKAFKLAPVMAASNYALESSPSVEKWFAASKGAAPLIGDASIGYDRSMSGSVTLLPLEMQMDDESHVSFSGLNLEVRSDEGASRVAAIGTMDSLKVDAVSEQGEPVHVQFQGLSLASDQTRAASGLYVGKSDFSLKTANIAIGENPAMVLADLAQRQDTRENGSNIEGSLTLDAGSISYADKPIGSAQMVWTMKNLDSVALKSLADFYGALYQQVGQVGEPNLEALTEAQQEQAKTDLIKLLEGKPQFALERFSLKTANGESRFSLALQLAKPASFDLPPDQLAREAITGLDLDLSLSKPMISDLISVQAVLQGEQDQEAIAQQASMTTEMASGMMLSTQLVALEGNDIRARLHYADGQVEFNGKKMTVEEFVGLVMASAGGLGAMGGEQPAFPDEEIPMPIEE